MLHYAKLTETIDLAWSDRTVPWKCNGLVIRGKTGNVLIDCNFSDDEIEDLIKRIPGTILAYFVTHMHIDHVNNLHFWEKYHIPIHCPVPEDGYLRDFKSLLDDSGSTSYGTNDTMLTFTRDIQGFREIPGTLGFVPGTSYRFGNITIDTLHLPGHSPGHTGFIITGPKAPGEQDVLFASDIGLDDFGPWYGFDYCDLTGYRRSIALLKKIYTDGDYILAGSHLKHVTEKPSPGVFDTITGKIDRTEDRLLSAIGESGPVELSDLVLTGIYYRLSSVEKMNEFIKGLYRFWEYNALKNHVKELAGSGLIEMYDDCGNTSCRVARSLQEAGSPAGG